MAVSVIILIKTILPSDQLRGRGTTWREKLTCADAREALTSSALSRKGAIVPAGEEESFAHHFPSQKGITAYGL